MWLSSVSEKRYHNTVRSWYSANINEFASTSTDEIIGHLSQSCVNDGFTAERAQIDAWKDEIAILRVAVKKINNATLYLEFNIPRMGKRIDAIILIHSDKPHILVLEFKVGQDKFITSDIDQVIDYSLELRNFHQGSHNATIFSVLVATKYDEEPINNANVYCMGSKHIAELRRLFKLYIIIEMNTLKTLLLQVSM